MTETSPTSRALLLLELVQNRPGIPAYDLSLKLGVSERAVRRYVGILREAGVPIESERGRYGGYRVGRGMRVPPLMFTQDEALALVMAVLDGHHQPTDTDDPVGSALGKIMRVLPASVAEPVEAVRRVPAGGRMPEAPSPAPDVTATLVQASAAHRRVRLAYELRPDRERPMDVDPWAVVARHRRWYLLCWSHTSDGQRVLRVDRVRSVELLPDTFAPPEDLNPVDALEDQLSMNWRYPVEVEIDASVEEVAECFPRSRGRLEAIDEKRCRLIGSTDEPDWYAMQLATLRANFRVIGSPEILAATQWLAQRLTDASRPPATVSRSD